MRVRRWFWLYVLPIVQMVAVARLESTEPIAVRIGETSFPMSMPLQPPWWPIVALVNLPAWMIYALSPESWRVYGQAASVVAAGGLWHVIGRMRLAPDGTPWLRRRATMAFFVVLAALGSVLSLPALIGLPITFPQGAHGWSWVWVGVILWTSFAWIALARTLKGLPRWLHTALPAMSAAFFAEFVVFYVVEYEWMPRTVPESPPPVLMSAASAVVVLLAWALVPRRLVMIGIASAVMHVVLVGRDPFGSAVMPRFVALLVWPAIAIGLGCYLRRRAARQIAY